MTNLCDRYLTLWELPGDDTADVIVAHDTVLDRLVDIRLLPLRGIEDRSRVARFAAGTTAAASVAHPGLATVLDRGEVAGRPFMVCARTPGATLAQEVDRNGPLSAKQAARTGATVADALTVAHRGGVVHDAVSVDTIIIGPDTMPILNLGLAARPTQRPADDVTALAATLLRVLAADANDTPLRWMLRLAAEANPRGDRFVPDAAGLADQLQQLGVDPRVAPPDVGSSATTTVTSELLAPTIELPITEPADPTRVLHVPTDMPTPPVPGPPTRRRPKRAVLAAAVAAVAIMVVALGYQAVATSGGPILVTKPPAASTSTTVAAAPSASTPSLPQPSSDETTTGVASSSGYPPAAKPVTAVPDRYPRAAPPAPTQSATPGGPKSGPGRAPSVAGGGPVLP